MPLLCHTSSEQSVESEFRLFQRQSSACSRSQTIDRIPARVAIQQRVTSNLLVTFATDITSTQRQAIKVEYKLNPKWPVSGTRNQNGGFGVDGRYRKDF
jgi:hypothetical protein